MRSSYLAATASIVVLIALQNLASADPLDPADISPSDSTPSVDSKKSGESDTASFPFDREILKATAEYKSWGRVDDEFRWAPTACRLLKPGRVYASASDEERTHGKKRLVRRIRGSFLVSVALQVDGTGHVGSPRRSENRTLFS